MSDKTLKDLTVDAHIAVLHTKVDALIEKQKELTERVRANEKVVAALGVLGTIAIAFIGAGAFAPRAEACSQSLDGSPENCGPGDRIVYYKDKEPDYDYYSTRDEIIWTAGSVIQEMRNWQAEQERIPVNDMLNNAIGDFYWEDQYGSDGSTEQEELLQLSSGVDRQGT